MGSLTLDVLLDENFDRQVIAYIETEGHYGEHVVDVLDSGAEDAADIAPYARSDDLLVLTKDTDFLETDEDDHAGVLFLVDYRRSAHGIASALITIADVFPDREHLRGIEYVDNRA